MWHRRQKLNRELRKLAAQGQRQARLAKLCAQLMLPSLPNISAPTSSGKLAAAAAKPVGRMRAGLLQLRAWLIRAMAKLLLPLLLRWSIQRASRKWSSWALMPWTKRCG